MEDTPEIQPILKKKRVRKPKVEKEIKEEKVVEKEIKEEEVSEEPPKKKRKPRAKSVPVEVIPEKEKEGYFPPPPEEKFDINEVVQRVQSLVDESNTMQKLYIKEFHGSMNSDFSKMRNDIHKELEMYRQEMTKEMEHQRLMVEAMLKKKPKDPVDSMFGRAPQGFEWGTRRESFF